MAPLAPAAPVAPAASHATAADPLLTIDVVVDDHNFDVGTNVPTIHQRHGSGAPRRAVAQIASVVLFPLLLCRLAVGGIVVAGAGDQRVLVVPHTRCAMTKMSENELRETITELSGQDAWWQHFHVVPDQRAALVEDVHRVTSHPLIGDRVAVGGFLYDVDTGRMEQLV